MKTMNDKRKTDLDMVSKEEWQTMDVKNEDPNVCQPDAPERIVAWVKSDGTTRFEGGKLSPSALIEGDIGAARGCA